MGNSVKQDWTTSDTYTYTGLTQGVGYSIKVETKLQNTGITGESKTTEIYTSKNVSGTNEGYTSNSTCTSSSYNISASGVYPQVTLSSPSCSSYQVQSGAEPKYTNCTTSYQATDSCDPTRSCTVNGYTGTINYDYSNILGTYSNCYEDDWSKWGQGSGFVTTCEVGSEEPPSCDTGAEEYELTVECEDLGDGIIRRTYWVYYRSIYEHTDYECYYSGDVETGSTPTYDTYYKANYSGVVAPSQTTY